MPSTRSLGLADGWDSFTGSDPVLPAWALLALCSGAIYYPAKAFTWWDAHRRGLRPGAGRSIAYLLLWPGMDARAFLDPRSRPAPTSAGEWTWAIGKTLFCAALLWGGVRLLPADDPYVVGAVGFACLFSLLLFGAFHVLSLVWRRLGIDAAPICREPWRATSLTDFWGRRWNLAFRDLAFPHVFLPLRRGLGPAGAAATTFLVSGLLHEVAMSVPARGGYGFPTLYFVLQATGTWLQRLTPRISAGPLGRFSTLLVVTSPLFLLFHPPFLERVAYPLVHALGAR